MRLLLADERVDPNTADKHYGDTALIKAAEHGRTPVVTLLLADERVHCSRTDHNGNTPLIKAALYGRAPVVALLLADQRVDPNTANQDGWTALIFACRHRSRKTTSVLELLLADHRIVRTRPIVGVDLYDAALLNVKCARHARFRGLVRAVVVFGRMRLRAAEAAYAPGGAGFAAAAASFEAGRHSAALN